MKLNANFNFCAPYLCLNETKNNYNITAYKIHARILAFSENRRWDSVLMVVYLPFYIYESVFPSLSQQAWNMKIQF